MHVSYWQGWGRPPQQGPYLTLDYNWTLPNQAGFRHCRIEESDHPRCSSGRVDWQTIRWNGQEFLLSDEEGPHWRLQCFRDSTIVDMWANVELEMLLDLAASLVPAPRQLLGFGS